MKRPLRWGICATVRASATDILNFAAYHLDLGAHRVWVLLDTPAPEAADALKSHPKCRVVTCDDAYWKRAFGQRPKKHQVRQSWNATRIYKRAAEVHWLLHADADEFLVSDMPVHETLQQLPEEALTARVRPMEALAVAPGQTGPRPFRNFIAPGPMRQDIVSRLYPRFGPCLRGGFLSHVAGKIFVRTGLQDIDLRIHNVFRGDVKNPGPADLTTMRLAHLHAPDWPTWRAHFDYRLAQGAYRADLAPARAAQDGGQTLHDCLSTLLTQEGENGLRAFFDEAVADSEHLRARLASHGLLQLEDLELTRKRRAIFPEVRDGVPTV